MRYFSARALGAGALVVAASALPASGALAAQSEPRVLGLPLPDVGQVVTSIGTTVGGTVDPVLPGTGGIVTGTTGAVGGIITGTTPTVTTTVDQTLGGILGGHGTRCGHRPDHRRQCPGHRPARRRAQHAARHTRYPDARRHGQRPGGRSRRLDHRGQPRARRHVQGALLLRGVKALGKLKLQVSSDEPGLVAFTSTLRPVWRSRPRRRSARHARGKARSSAAKHSRKVIHIAPVSLGFRKAGKLKVTVQLSRAAQRNLGNSRNARISVGLLAADAARNQLQERVKQTVKR